MFSVMPMETMTVGRIIMYSEYYVAVMVQRKRILVDVDDGVLLSSVVVESKTGAN